MDIKSSRKIVTAAAISALAPDTARDYSTIIEGIISSYLHGAVAAIRK
jgi:hypothetical protein